MRDRMETVVSGISHIRDTCFIERLLVDLTLQTCTYYRKTLPKQLFLNQFETKLGGWSLAKD